MAEGQSTFGHRHTAVFGGRRVVVTRGGAEGRQFASELEVLGAETLFCPSIQIMPPTDAGPLQRAIAAMESFDWIVFTSVNAVRAVAAEWRRLRMDGRSCRMAAVGPATATAILEAGWHVEYQTAHGGAAELAIELPLTHGARVLLPRGNLADARLPHALSQRGGTVHEVIAYRTVPHADVEVCRSQLCSGGPVDALTFTSPSTIDGFMRAADAVPWNPRALQQSTTLAIACIGRTTAAALAAHGLQATTIAREQSLAGLIDALAEALSTTSPSAYTALGSF